MKTMMVSMELKRVGTGILFALCGLLAGGIQTAGAQELTLHENLREIQVDKVGPFVRLGDGGILTVGRTDALISHDEGQTWESYPIFENPDAFSISARAIQRLESGVVVMGFSNMAERHWTWDPETRQAPGAILPTYAVRSLDDGRTWEAPQKLHEEWTGSVRDMIVTRDGKIVFTTMMTRDDPLRHTVLTYTREAERGQSRMALH